MIIVRKEMAKTEERLLREEAETRAVVAEREAETREAREWEEIEKAFIAAFPGVSDQERILAENRRGMPFSAHTEIGRAFGMRRWFKNRPFLEQV